MSKDETSPGGLLSKMVRFVRNPTVDWKGLDSIEADRESQYSKQMLKEMIERKRRNDFVRRREFDQLRKLRQREALQGQRTEDPTARPSFFQSSMASSDERAVTLKKIDEIEAQMSRQWWKSKQAPPVAAPVPDAGSEPVAEMSDSEHARAFAPTVPVTLPGFLGGADAAELSLSGESAPVVDRGIAMLLPPNPVPVGAVVPAPVVQRVEAQEQEFVHEPDLEEAAILFANGSHTGAEDAVRDVLAQHQQDAPARQFAIWMALFDLYRAIGERDRFEVSAIDFAARFGRSAPLWFSMPEQLGLPHETAVAEAAPLAREFGWTAPAVLTVQSLAALEATLRRAASPWMLTWSRLASIDEAAVPTLAHLITQWADQSVQLNFRGVDVLNAVLRSNTPSGDRAGSPQWWRLRMAVLRLMNRPDEFELVALDYCVTYEVSPPSWEPPRCGYVGDDGVPSSESAEDGSSAIEASVLGSLLAPLEDEPMAALSGQIDGDAQPVLESFGALVRPGMPLIVSCERLIRIDFAAASSVLNWAAERQAQGVEVWFTGLQRLVAIFFNVIGINEHARVVPRKN